MGGTVGVPIIGLGAAAGTIGVVGQG